MAHVDKKAKLDDLSASPTLPSSSTPPPPPPVGDEVRETLQQSVGSFLSIRDQIESRLKLLEEKEKWHQETEQLKEEYLKALDEKVCLDIGL